MNKNQKKQLIKKLESLRGVFFELKQMRRRLEENPDNQAREKLLKLESEYNQIINAIDKIESPYKREIIRMRYIDNATWKAIAFEFYGHEGDFTDSLDRYLRRCYDARNSALVELEKNLK